MHNRILAAAIVVIGYLIWNPQPLPGQVPLTIRVLAAFDYPGSGNSTTVEGINDDGDVTGYFADGRGAIRGFIRFADGTFSTPVIEPNDTGNVTVATDINNLGQVCGYYHSSDIYYPYRGFILSDGIFTEYGPGGSDYYITGINDSGDYCATLDFHYLVEGLLADADRGMVYFNVGNSAQANAINLHTGIVGNYGDDQSGMHGYLRGTEFFFTRIHAPVDYPGASQTFLLGLNDGGRVVVGKYVDSVGGTHGLVFERPDTFTSFDYPGAIETSLNAINNHKIVAGYYANGSGVHHGFIAKIIEAH